MADVVALCGDLHCGSTVALHPNDVTALDDGGEYHPTKAQQWLWQGWTRYWQAVRQARTSKDRLTVIINGDLVDGDHHGTAQIVSGVPGVQFDILTRCLEPMLALQPAHVIVIRGTSVHDGKNGSGAEAAAKWLSKRVDVPRCPVTGNYSHWHWQGDFSGHVINCTHHGKLGKLPWTKHNGAISLAAQIFFEKAKRRERWPDLAVRSHLHQTADTHDAQPVRVLALPAWQLHTEYTYRIVPDSLADIGGCIAVCAPGQKLRVETILQRPDPLPIWKAT